MSEKMYPRSFFSSFFPFDDPSHHIQADHSGISIWEEEQSVFVEASLPGIKPEEIDLTFNKGVLVIKAEKKEENRQKKFYQKALSNFFYQVTVPGNIDENKEPEASCAHGILTIRFPKQTSSSQSKKISVKKS